MEYDISVTRNDDGTFTAECPSILGCVRVGSTELEVEKNIRKPNPVAWGRSCPGTLLLKIADNNDESILSV